MFTNIVQNIFFFRTKWGCVNDERNVISRWTIHNSVLHVIIIVYYVWIKEFDMTGVWFKKSVIVSIYLQFTFISNLVILVLISVSSPDNITNFRLNVLSNI